MAQQKEATITVRSEDPKDDKKEKKPNGDKKNKPDEEEELSEEDATLKGELELLVQRLKESDTTLYRPALETLRTLIRTSTSSMTSVPKPLKFLRPHFEDLKKVHSTWPDPPSSTAAASETTVQDKHLFADILSVLAMTYSDSGLRETLKFRLDGGSQEDPGLWGNEYVRHLASEIGDEVAQRFKDQKDQIIRPIDQKIFDLAIRLVQFFLQHNGEADAVDILAELDAVEKIVPYVDENNFSRVCQYIVALVNLSTPPDDIIFLKTALEIYRNYGRKTEALALALRSNDYDLVKQIFEDSNVNSTMRRQLGYILGRHPVAFEGFENEDEELVNILQQKKLSEHFRSFAKTLDLMEPKVPEDIYKTHLEAFKTQAGGTNPARQNLAEAFVNGFVNAGFGNDKLLAAAPAGNSLIYKNKAEGMLSATASLGLSFLWDIEHGLDVIDSFTRAPDSYIQAGAHLATGMAHAGVHCSEVALSLLAEPIESENESIKNCAIMGLGIALAGLRSEDSMITERFHQIITDSTTSMQTVAMTALSLAFVYVGSADGDVTAVLLQAMMERPSSDLESMWGRYLALALGLLFLGRQEQGEVPLEALKTMAEPFAKQATVICDMCAYAGTGNVLKVQQLLSHCSQHHEPEKNEDLHQGFAVIGIALVAMGEDVGSEMVFRQMNHLMHYGSSRIRVAVPLALALLSISNPKPTIVEILSKYSHDNDAEVALSAVFAMGLVGAGTNNAKLARLLRQLAGYWYKDDDLSFGVRIAQGLVHMGKGLIGLTPFHTDRSIISPVTLAGLLTSVIVMSDARRTIFGGYHHLIYYLAMSMNPRFLITLDTNGEPIKTSVRVGQAVDVVGQAGKPRTISGFQTHDTPVRIATTERAELASEEYISFTHALEGFVILAKNELYENDEMDTR